MDNIFTEIINLDKKLRSDSDSLQIPPSDDIGIRLNSSYIRDEANFKSMREFYLAFGYFFNDFQRTNAAFLNSIDDLERIPLNKPEFFNSLNYSNLFSNAINYRRRALLDYSAISRLEFFKPEDKIFKKYSRRELSSLLQEMEEVFNCELDFPGLGIRVQNSFVSLTTDIKHEDYEHVLFCKEELIKDIRAKYASSSPRFLGLFDERFSEIIYVCQNS